MCEPAYEGKKCSCCTALKFPGSFSRSGVDGLQDLDLSGFQELCGTAVWNSMIAGSAAEDGRGGEKGVRNSRS